MALLTIICAVIIFSVIIFVHELGHFVTARIFGVTVHEFAIGMGPAIWTKQGKETQYSVRAIPMGGYCKIEGEDEDSAEPGSFSRKEPLSRIIILAAGAIMNLLLGFFVMICLTSVTAISNGGMPSTIVESVNPESDAAEFLQKGDRIVGVNGKRVNIRRDLSFELSRIGSNETDLTFIRNGEKITEKFIPMPIEYDDGTEGYVVGFNISMQDISIGNILRESFYQTIWMVKLVFVSLGMLFTGEAGVADLSGPVGVVNAMNTAAQTGWFNFLYFAAFLAVNIGIMNLLPLPALDGGRLFFQIIEVIRKKPIDPEKEGIVTMIGFVALMVLMVFVMFNDISKLIT